MIALLTCAQLLLIFSLFLLFLACDPVYTSIQVDSTQEQDSETASIPVLSYGRISILHHLPKSHPK